MSLPIKTIINIDFVSLSHPTMRFTEVGLAIFSKRPEKHQTARNLLLWHYRSILSLPGFSARTAINAAHAYKIHVWIAKLTSQILYIWMCISIFNQVILGYNVQGGPEPRSNNVSNNSLLTTLSLLCARKNTQHGYTTLLHDSRVPQT